jgi:hypothetical protein
MSATQKASFKTLSNATLSKLYNATEFRAIAKFLGITLKGDARKKGVKYAWTRQIKSAMETLGMI